MTTAAHNLDIIWPRLISITDEVATSLIRSAFSHDVVEVHDMSVGVFDHTGRMLAQTPLGATGHTMPMSAVMKVVLEQVNRDEIRPGDVFVTNDPWIQSGHTADVYTLTPIFSKHNLFGFLVNTVHHLDIGGRAGSGLSEEVYEEGLILPILKLQEEGKLNETLFKIFARNFRFSEKVIGDFRAQIAAGQMGSERVLALQREFGLSSLISVGDEIVGRSEKKMRDGIRSLGQGSHHMDFPIEVFDDNGKPLTLSLTMEVIGDEIHADFSGTSAQIRSPINCPYNFTTTYVIAPTKMVCSPDTPNNEGTFRPFRFKIPEGSLVNPTFPAAVYWRLTTGHIVADMSYLLLGQFSNEKSLSGSGTLPTWYFHTSGVRTNGEMFMVHQHGFGGMGGRPGRDGLNTVGFPYTVRNVPIEEVESEVPLLFLGRRFIPDSGGAGQWRGGLSEELKFTGVPGGDIDPSKPITVSGAGGRLTYPALGVDGGKPGSRAEIYVNESPLDNRTWEGSGSVEFKVNISDTVTMRFPGGGGMGSPKDRDQDLIAKDLLDGNITTTSAEQDYGWLPKPTVPSDQG